MKKCWNPHFHPERCCLFIAHVQPLCANAPHSSGSWECLRYLGQASSRILAKTSTLKSSQWTIDSKRSWACDIQYARPAMRRFPVPKMTKTPSTSGTEPTRKRTKSSNQTLKRNLHLDAFRTSWSHLFGASWTMSIGSDLSHRHKHWHNIVFEGGLLCRVHHCLPWSAMPPHPNPVTLGRSFPPWRSPGQRRGRTIDPK